MRAAVELGLDSFTLDAVSARAGVAESTVYNYVSSRDELYASAADSVFSRLDVDVAAASWADYVDEVAARAVALASAHPGLREYVLHGPYEPATIETFEVVVARVRGWLPDISEHVAFLVASRPMVVSLAQIGDPVLEPAVPWLRRALLHGLDASLAAGELPPAPERSWRSKLRAAGPST